MLFTLSLVVIVPLVTWGAYRWAERRTAAAGVHMPLRWAERATWEAARVTPGTLKRGEMSSARTGKRYFEYPDPVTAEGLQVMLEVSRLTQNEEVFSSIETGDKLKAILKVGEKDSLMRSPSLTMPEKLAILTEVDESMFYVHYILGVWYARWSDVPEGRIEHFIRAFADAPAVLVQRHVYADGSPVVGYQPPPLRLAFDRVREDAVDPSLTLWYPVLPTDETGRVYVPVWRGVLRQVDPGWPEGVPVPEAEADWRVWPGRVGELEPVVHGGR